jgi:hypothetical protein
MVYTNIIYKYMYIPILMDDAKIATIVYINIHIYVYIYGGEESRGIQDSSDKGMYFSPRN